VDFVNFGGFREFRFLDPPGMQWSNYSIIYEGPENMASDSEPRKFFLEAPSEVTFRESKSLYGY